MWNLKLQVPMEEAVQCPWLRPSRKHISFIRLHSSPAVSSLKKQALRGRKALDDSADPPHRQGAQPWWIWECQSGASTQVHAADEGQQLHEVQVCRGHNGHGSIFSIAHLDCVWGSAESLEEYVVVEELEALVSRHGHHSRHFRGQRIRASSMILNGNK